MNHSALSMLEQVPLQPNHAELLKWVVGMLGLNAAIQACRLCLCVFYWHFKGTPGQAEADPHWQQGVQEVPNRHRRIKEESGPA
jgi:hypothetical protein